MFSTEALEQGILDIEKNIKVFEKQIVSERSRITEYRDMIEVLKNKATEAKIAKALEESINGGKVTQDGDNTNSGVPTGKS